MGPRQPGGETRQHHAPRVRGDEPGESAKEPLWQQSSLQLYAGMDRYSPRLGCKSRGRCPRDAGMDPPNWDEPDDRLTALRARGDGPTHNHMEGRDSVRSPMHAGMDRTAQGSMRSTRSAPRKRARGRTRSDSQRARDDDTFPAFAGMGLSTCIRVRCADRAPRNSRGWTHLHRPAEGSDEALPVGCVRGDGPATFPRRCFGIPMFPARTQGWPWPVHRRQDRQQALPACAGNRP